MQQAISLFPTKSYRDFIQRVGPQRRLVPFLRALACCTSWKPQGTMLQGFQFLMVGAESNQDDGHSFSYPFIASRRTFPPVGPLTSAHKKEKRRCSIGSGWPPRMSSGASWLMERWNKRKVAYEMLEHIEDALQDLNQQGPPGEGC